MTKEQSIGQTGERQEVPGPRITGSERAKRRIEFEVIQGATISQSDLEFLAKMFARAISRNLEIDTSKTSQKGDKIDLEPETGRS